MKMMVTLLKMSDSSQAPKNSNPRKKYFSVLLLLPLAVYFYFGLQHLTQFETADEHYWIYSNYNNNNYWESNDGRIHQYWEAIKRGDWKKTRINDKPGITLAYVAGIGSWQKTELEKQISQGVVAPMTKLDKAEWINLYFHLPILIFNGLFSLLIFYLLRGLTQNDWVALLSAALILLSPIIIGISQIVNPDALLWEFGFAALLSYLTYLKTERKKYAFFASLFLGLSLLTKYSSVVFFPFFFLIMILFIFELKQSGESYKAVRRYAIAYFFMIIGALAIYAVLLPNNLLEFRHFMKGSLGFKGMQVFFMGILGANLLVLLDSYFFQSFFLYWIRENYFALQKYIKQAVFGLLALVFTVVILNAIFGKDWLMLFAKPFDAASKSIFSKLPFWQVALKQFMPLIFSLSPAVIFFLVYAWIKSLRQPHEFRWIIFVFSLFLLVLVAASMQQNIMMIIRYSIMLYPLIFTMAAIGVYQFFALDKKSGIFRGTIFFAIIFFGIASLWGTKPFYFNYMNFLLPQKYLVTDAWGYGGYEAAEQLNQLPNAEKMRVWSDYNGTCLFFNGDCAANYLTMQNIRKKSENLPRFDYFVSSRRGSILSHSVWTDLKEDYTIQQVWETQINGRPENFVKIYKVTPNENSAFKN